MVMLGAAEALRRNDHISVDLLTTRLQGTWALAFKIWWMLCVIAVAAAIIHSGIKSVRFSYDFGIYSEGYLETPMWLPQSVLLVGAGLLLLSALARIATLLLGPGKKR
jgi:TRAP-type C4-dicarboxylate transport system permease small subunit